MGRPLAIIVLVALGVYSDAVGNDCSSRIMVDGKSCATSKSAVLVEYEDWQECLSYYIVGEDLKRGVAIIFIEGDVRASKSLFNIEVFHKFAEDVNEAIYAYRNERVPIVILGRPGLYGSSGDHEYRHRGLEYGLVGRAIGKIAQHYGLTRIALVGHSGGSSAIMGALSLGITDGNCVVAGSGGYELAEILTAEYKSRGIPVTREVEREWRNKYFSHHRALDGISKLTPRRFFFVGDPNDSFAPISQQVRYAEALRRAGHPVRMVEARSPRGDNHTFVRESLKASARCLKGEDDDSVARTLETDLSSN